VLGAGGGAVTAPKRNQPPRKGVAGAGAGGNAQYLRAGDPRRMIVGHMVFPMKDQVLEFQRALKLASQKEMFDAPRDDLPTIAGFDLYKIEILPNGQPAKKDPEVLLFWDSSAKKLIVAEKLKKFLSVAVFDERGAAALEPYIYSGLTMPLPQLAFGAYPPVSLDGGIQSSFEEEGKEPGMPNPKGPGMRPKGPGLPGFGPGKKEGGAKQPAMDKDGQKAEASYIIAGKSRKDLQAGGPDEQALDSRLFENDFNIYHALGLKPAAPGEAAAPNPNRGFGPPRGPAGGGGAQGMDRFVDAWNIKTGEVGPDGKLIEAQPPANQPLLGKQPPLGPKKGPGAADPNAAPAFRSWDRDAVVRFIDVDVEPGKTYQYAIRVRLKNPNYNKQNLVAFAALALPDELPPSDWVYTERITIPRDYHLYAIDQLLEEGKQLPPFEAKVKDATTFQIHKWTKTPVDTRDQRLGFPIGDWAIAERVLVHKGNEIGRDALVNVPYWVKEEDMFKLKKNPGNAKPGLKIDMEPPIFDNAAGNGIVGDAGFPVLIDFTGGKRKVAPNSNVDEEVAVDALIVGVDGKLRVLNSRDAADAATPAGADRQARVTLSRARVDEVNGTTPTGPNTPKKGLPGVNN
jgi:hypothetical protein